MPERNNAEIMRAKIRYQEILASKKPRLLVIIDQDLKDDFERLCKIENRSMSNMVNVLIQNAVKKAKKEGKFDES